MLRIIVLLILVTVLTSGCYVVYETPNFHNSSTLLWESSSDKILAGCIKGIARFQLFLLRNYGLDFLMDEVREDICVDLFREESITETVYDT